LTKTVITISRPTANIVVIKLATKTTTKQMINNKKKQCIDWQKQ